MRLLSIVILCTAVAGCSKEQSEQLDPLVEAPQADIADVSRANNEFAIDLYKQLVKDEPTNKNILVSPYSINAALAMTYAGAGGETAKEMATVLHYDLPQKKLHPAQGALSWKLRHAEGEGQPKLNIANSLWPDAGLSLKPEFLDVSKKNYRSNVYPVDYADSLAAANAINAWVKEQTHGMIPEVLQPGDVDSGTLLCLVNAIYFQGDWANAFAKSATQEREFIVAKGETVMVPMMEDRKHKLRYSTTNDFSMAIFPYKGESQSMVIMLPHGYYGLAEVEKKLTAEMVQKSIESAVVRNGWVRIPKFKSKSRFSLAPTLGSMGMSQLFSTGADLNGISDKPIFVDKVIHEAVVEVDEAGTEAAAATVVSTEKMSAPGGSGGPSQLFVADHPFVYMIYDHPTKTILFIGRYVDPKGN